MSQQGTVVEKQYKNETYTISTVSYDQNNLRSDGMRSRTTSISSKIKVKISEGTGYRCTIEESTPIKDILKQVIPEAKIKTLASDKKNHIRIKFIYNKETGKVIYVKFHLRGYYSLSEEEDSDKEITLKEINKLETLLNKYSFKLSNCEEGGKYRNWMMAFFFYRLLEEDKK
ncbi:hypothetical protein FACS18947_2570 [Bacteroidia bacterium]|nr:hypothetical protein FACS18947_2570 [Bacteroidia bacterium]